MYKNNDNKFWVWSQELEIKKKISSHDDERKSINNFVQTYKSRLPKRRFAYVTLQILKYEIVGFIYKFKTQGGESWSGRGQTSYGKEGPLYQLVPSTKIINMKNLCHEWLHDVMCTISFLIYLLFCAHEV